MKENRDRAFRGLPICNFWFAEYDDTQQSGTCKWTPVMQWNGAMMGGSEIWFETQRDCEEFIRDEIIGAVGHYEALKAADPQ